MTRTIAPHRTLMADALLAFYNAETQPMPPIGKQTENRGVILDAEDKHPGKTGKIGWALLWLMGIPIPLLLLLFFMRGCT